MLQVKIDTGSAVSIIDVDEDSWLREPIVIKIELLIDHGTRVVSRAFRIVEVHDNHLVVN